MNKFYVYRYIRLDTEMPFYVGKGCGRRAGKRTRHNEYCQRIMAKAGFRIEYIMKGLSEQAALNKETEFITMYKRIGLCEANLLKGKDSLKAGFRGGFHGKKHSTKTKALIKKSMTGSKNPFHGKKHSAETKEKLRATKGTKILDTKSGTIYRSVKEAAQVRNIPLPTLKKYLYKRPELNNTGLVFA